MSDSARHPETRRHFRVLDDVLDALRSHDPLVALLDGGTNAIAQQETTRNMDDLETRVLVDIANMQSAPTSVSNSEADYQLQVLVRYTKHWHMGAVGAGYSESYGDDYGGLANPDGAAWRYHVLDELSAALADAVVADTIPQGPQDTVGPEWDDSENCYVFDVTFEYSA